MSPRPLARAGGCRLPLPTAEPAPPLTAHQLSATRPPTHRMTTTDRMTAAHHP
ncbi:hypothetical protein ACSAM2_00630 [Actinomyces oris]|uniref:hypothetical protein n=1 Tax=Actinomyces TaxID=1654 RepID=UPI0039BE6E5E